MENKFQRLAVANSTENAVNVHDHEQEYGEDGDEGEEEEEEALSFCDLPLDHLSRNGRGGGVEEEDEERIPLRANESQEDFHFCYSSNDSEMCDADEVFFQGQILPLRHSLSSDKGSFQYHRSISKSGSIGGSSSITLFSSRSSSISSSHRSYSSRSSAAATQSWCRIPNPQQNHSHSHRNSPPSTYFPIPGIIRTNNVIYSKKTSSSAWSILRLGILVTSQPEIAFKDLKTRSCPILSTNRKNLRSRNSNIKNKVIIGDGLKRKPRGLLGGCNCSNDAVDAVRSRVMSTKKSSVAEMEKQADAAVKRTGSAKKQWTHYRTFEWLKQLSLEDTAEEK
ncbi:hypothetical protein F511_30465 [Dorcoceras hygrometricum]|uniref:Uncharacterized protein n=1 Tax=Dorcoceras hygrometricum TaxID=472368 RepID=A0A2Z7BTP6_9LAMI|nr:hypothetical protein F511_30465 [Dorcoceras hygrometricum]